jgi:signal transduction histidine kinase
MQPLYISPELDKQIGERAVVLRKEYDLALWKQTDRMFAMLLLVQWLAAVAMAIWLSPRAWEGLDHRIHPHIWAAVFLGGVITVYPIVFVLFRPGEAITRYVIATAQMLYSALLIHLSGGRLETHFHVFGSLAFLSFYRDWRVLVPATIVVALDHAVRGTFWPESVFGIATLSPWRWIEHAGWVVFEDIILVWSCLRGAKELGIHAMRQALLEATNQRVEAEVTRQTARLEQVSQELLATARRAGMADIATGVLHNVGNVLNSVNVSSTLIADTLRKLKVAGLAKIAVLLGEHEHDLGTFMTTDPRGIKLPGFLGQLAAHLTAEQEIAVKEVDHLQKNIEHIKEIVKMQQIHASSAGFTERLNLRELIDTAIQMNTPSLNRHAVAVVRKFENVPPVATDKHKVLQILVNLITNARQAMKDSPEKILTVGLGPAAEGSVRIFVRDTGSGVAPENTTRIFAHGFTTKTDGHGFGLHSSALAAKEMRGSLTVHSDGPGKGAIFTLELPVAVSKLRAA